MSSWRREQTGKEVASNLTAHSGLVNDLQLSVDQGMIITASKDMHSKVRDWLHVVTSIRLLSISPKLLDADTLDVVKTYVTDRPVNSACIAPDRVTPNRSVAHLSLSFSQDYVIVGGGQEAMSVTTTATKAGKFEARFFHTVRKMSLSFRAVLTNHC